MPQLPSYLPSFLALGALLLVSVVLMIVRPHLRPEARSGHRFVAVMGLTVLAQGIHFLEELRSHFSARFPETFGLQPIPEKDFVVFNVAWLAIWVIAVFAVRAGVAVATCPLWFLGLAAVLNLVAHPILAFYSGGYFPGLLTAPLVGALGILATLEMVRVTAPRVPSRDSDRESLE